MNYTKKNNINKTYNNIFPINNLNINYTKKKNIFNTIILKV
jgi:hypothetical protein